MKTVPVKTFYLQMLARPERGVQPPMEGVHVVRVEKPSTEFYRTLYEEVGRDWTWVNRRLMSDDALREIIHDDRVEIYVLHVDAAPAGFAELDRRTDGQIELAYFGLLPEFIGKGLGKHFLNRIIQKAWTYAPRRIWVHTCVLDHRAALPMYLGAGFEIFDEKLVDQVMP